MATEENALLNLLIRAHDESSGTLSKVNEQIKSMGGLSTITGAAGMAALGGIAVESVHLAEAYQQSTARIAANADISIAKAGEISRAFLQQGHDTLFSAQEMTDSYSKVGGQLSQIPGYVNDAAHAMDFMRSATTLAEGSNISLDTASKALVSTMKTFSLTAKDSAGASDVLYNVTRLTGLSADTFSTQVARMVTRLGPAAPSLKDAATAMDLLNSSGVQGRGLMQATMGINKLVMGAAAIPDPVKAGDAALKQMNDQLRVAGDAAAAADKKLADLGGGPNSTLGRAQVTAKAAHDRLDELTRTTGTTKAQLDEAAKSAKKADDALKGLHQTGPVTAAQLDAASLAADKAHAALDKLTLAASGTGGKMTPLQTTLAQLGIRVYDANGKFTGMQSLLTQLAPKLANMTEKQRLHTEQVLFGSATMDKMLMSMANGRITWEQAAATIGKAGSAHSAAEKQMETLEGAQKRLKKELADAGVEIGSKLLPSVQDLATKGLPPLTAAVGFLSDHLNVIAPIMLALFGMMMAQKAATIAASMATNLWTIATSAWTVATNVARVAQVAWATITGVATGEVTAMAAAQWLWNIALDANPIGLIIIAIVALIAVGVLLVTHWKDITRVAGQLGHAIMDGAGKAFNWVKANWPLLLAILTGPIGLAVLFIATHMEQIKATISGIIKWVTDEIPKLPEQIGYAIGAAVVWFYTLPTRIQDALVHVIRVTAQWQLEFAQRAIAAAQNFVEGLGRFLVALPGNVGNWLSAVIPAVLQWGANLLITAIQAGVNFVQGLNDELRKLPGQAVDIGVDIVKGIITGIVSMTGKAIGAIGDFVTGLVKGAHDAGKGGSPYMLFAEEVGQVGIGGGVIRGIQTITPAVVNAMSNQMTTVASVTRGAAPVGMRASSMMMAGGRAGGGGVAGGPPIEVTMLLDGKKLSKVVMVHAGREYRLKGGGLPGGNH